ncbi:MAG: hypothetical protein K1X79_05270 [Oligoflexia bacterium]|nr:hypothetical protein [Oligoflexia bacterium]
MTQLAHKQNIQPEPVPQALHDAFKRFEEASSRLEERYQSLVAETEVLRQQLEEKDAAIKRAERLAVVGEAAAAIAHEVRNPLGAMKLFASLLKRDLAERPDSQKLVEQISRNIETIDNVVSNMLHFSKGPGKVRAPINVHALLAEHVEHFRLLSDGKVTFDVALDGNPFILGDEHRLRQVFYNIMLNALQAMAFRGTLRIASKNMASGALGIEFEDSGPGIPQELLGKLFEPFASGRQGGTGLGLAIVKQVIEEHSGTVSAQNRGGACFEVCLPRGNEKI